MPRQTPPCRRPDKTVPGRRSVGAERRAEWCHSVAFEYGCDLVTVEGRGPGRWPELLEELVPAAWREHDDELGRLFGQRPTRPQAPRRAQGNGHARRSLQPDLAAVTERQSDSNQRRGGGADLLRELCRTAGVGWLARRGDRPARRLGRDGHALVVGDELLN